MASSFDTLTLEPCLEESSRYPGSRPLGPVTLKQLSRNPQGSLGQPDSRALGGAILKESSRNALTPLTRADIPGLLLRLVKEVLTLSVFDSLKNVLTQ